MPLKESINPWRQRWFKYGWCQFCLILVFQWAPDAMACQICIPFPQETLADRLSEYEDIIFVREKTNVPFVFESVETLLGNGTKSPIEAFCDSATRRRLKTVEGSVLVMGRRGGDVSWKRITYADLDYQLFIRGILENLKEWEGSDQLLPRYGYFSGYLTNPKTNIREQAYLEVGRAPYQYLKTLAREIPREQVYSFLADFRFIEWHRLFILFLGQSNNREDQSFIKEQVESLATMGRTLNLAAWVTAYIESHPQVGLENVETWYFKGKGRTQEELDQVLSSLSVLGSQEMDNTDVPSTLRAKIINAFGSLLNNYPEMAGTVARDLSMWRVRAHVDLLSTINGQKLIEDPAAQFHLDYYLSMAPRFPNVGPSIFED